MIQEGCPRGSYFYEHAFREKFLRFKYKIAQVDGADKLGRAGCG
jgi:hypothetical protein